MPLPHLLLALRCLGRLHCLLCLGQRKLEVALLSQQAACVLVASRVAGGWMDS